MTPYGIYIIRRPFFQSSTNFCPRYIGTGDQKKGKCMPMPRPLLQATTNLCWMFGTAESYIFKTNRLGGENEGGWGGRERGGNERVVEEEWGRGSEGRNICLCFVIRSRVVFGYDFHLRIARLGAGSSQFHPNRIKREEIRTPS